MQLRSGTHKLTARYLGPFRVLGTVNDNAVTLDLPPLLGALHPTINISRLQALPRWPGTFPRAASAAAAAAGSGDGHQRRGQLRGGMRDGSARRGARRELLVRWKGYGAEDDEWQPRSELVRSAPLAVAQYDALQRGDTPRGGQAALSQLLRTCPHGG